MKSHLRLRFLTLVFVLIWTVMPALSQTAPTVQRDLFGASQSIGDLWTKTELYFGTSKPDGTIVTDEEFKRFLDAVVTPRFPDGLTLLTGFGQFRNSAGVILQERSMLLILFYPPSKDANRKIEEIRKIYVRTFNQESVLRADSLSLVSF